MFSTLRTRFGIPGVISVIALAFAMFGGAYAASNSGGGKATASAKPKKGPRGPKGATGPVGPAGPQGPAGPAGAKGDVGANGKDGTNGTNGTNGANGTSVIAGTEATGTANCEGRGGSKFVTGATTTFACNGKEGPEGVGGGGGGFPATLPSGKTETGAWWFKGEGTPTEVQPISFAIPLSASDAAAIQVHYWTEASHNGCSGTPAVPTAPAGDLCLYISETTSASTPEVYSPDFVTQGVGTSGALLYVESAELTTKYQGGSFAVTAP
jgi:hypothetical protein